MELRSQVSKCDSMIMNSNVQLNHMATACAQPAEVASTVTRSLLTVLSLGDGIMCGREARVKLAATVGSDRYLST